MLVWRGTLSKFGHFLILSTNHSHASSKLSKSSQNWYSTKIFVKYPTHNYVEISDNFSVFLSSMRKVFLPQRKVGWGSLSSGSLCNKTFTAWCINVPFFVNRPTWMNLSVWEIGTKLGSDPGIKNFGIDCDCGGECSELWSGKLGAKLDGMWPTKTDTIIQDHHHHHQDNHHHQPRLAGTCPVLCSSNGEYEEGACRCYPGWKGAECSIRHNECEVIAKDNLVWIVRFTFTFFLQSFRITLPTWAL